MGVDFSKESVKPLATACVAEIAHFSPAQFHELRKALLALRVTPGDDGEDDQTSTSTAGNGRKHDWSIPDLAAAHVTATLVVVGASPQAIEVFERICILMDRTGDECINSLELFIGLSILVVGDITTKFQLAMDCLWDELQGTPVQSSDLVFLVSTMTTVANYFGDPLLPQPVLETIADDLLHETCDVSTRDSTAEGRHASAVQAFVRHPLVLDYIQSTGP